MNKSFFKKILIKLKLKNNKFPILSDGSSFCIGSFPLPEDHWLYEDKINIPPMPFRVGISETRKRLEDDIKLAIKYAIKASTMNGKEKDFDPDAMVQNMIVGMLGYFTEDGYNSDPLFNPPKQNVKCENK